MGTLSGLGGSCAAVACDEEDAIGFRRFCAYRGVGTWATRSGWRSRKKPYVTNLTGQRGEESSRRRAPPGAALSFCPRPTGRNMESGRL